MQRDPAEEVDELRSLARLGFDELRGAAGGIGDVHRAIAARAFGATGRAAVPARALHDAISRGRLRRPRPDRAHGGSGRRRRARPASRS